MRRFAALLALLCAPAALADGAFPDGMNVLFSASAPNRIVLATNFGLVISNDDGATFHYSCETYIRQDAAENVSLYQQGPDGALYAIFYSGMTRSGDVGCTWTKASGLPAVIDAFVDPNDATHVIAIASPGGGDELRPSHDGGLTFGAALYAAPGHQLFGIELSKSQPGVIYATEYLAPASLGASASAWLVASTDAGATWTRHPLPVTGTTSPFLLAVHPTNPQAVFLRLSGPEGDSLVVTTDGGATFSTLLSLPIAFSAFLRASDGTLYVGTASGDLWSRAPLTQAFVHGSGPLLRCLGQSGDGTIYACGDPLRDSFNLGKSVDGGKTFTKVMLFSDLLGPLTCSAAANACASDWATLQKVLSITPKSTASSGGCHCGSAAEAGPLALLILFAGIRRRRR